MFPWQHMARAGYKGVELMCAAQGIEFRMPLLTSEKLKQVMSVIRKEIPTVEQDRYLADDISRAAAMVSDGKIITNMQLSGYCVGETVC